LAGEIALELGDYAKARIVFDSLRREPLPDVAALRYARWLEITGRPDAAESRLMAVLADWKRVPDVAPSNLAWLYLRLADLAMKTGRVVGADSALTTGLRVSPGDYRLLGAAARLALRRGNTAQAMDLGERAIAINLDPATLGVLSDAYAARGDTARANEMAAVMRTVAFGDGAAFPHRSWSLWMLDHDRDVAEVLRLARAELKERKDVYGWDLYAWALYKSGRTTEARDAMREALHMGTRDELLVRHAEALLGAER
jgi:tetratricopeptide (TPR) repeat protein